MHVIKGGEGYSPGNNMVRLGRVFKAGKIQPAMDDHIERVIEFPLTLLGVEYVWFLINNNI